MENKNQKRNIDPQKTSAEKLNGRFVALWVLPIFLINKISKFSKSAAFIKPY